MKNYIMTLANLLYIYIYIVYTFTYIYIYGRGLHGLGRSSARPGREIQYQEWAGPKCYWAEPVFCKLNYFSSKISHLHFVVSQVFPNSPKEQLLGDDDLPIILISVEYLKLNFLFRTYGVCKWNRKQSVLLYMIRTLII